MTFKLTGIGQSERWVKSGSVTVTVSQPVCTPIVVVSKPVAVRLKDCGVEPLLCVMLSQELSVVASQ